MIEDHSVVEQAHEIHMLANDLKNYSRESPYVLPDKFVAGGIILPQLEIGDFGFAKRRRWAAGQEPKRD